MSCSRPHHHMSIPEGLFPVLMDVLDIALTVVSLIPQPIPVAGQVGMAAAAITIALNALLDDPIMMVLSVITLVPVAGQFSGIIKIVYRITRILQRVLGSPIVPVGIAAISLISIAGLYYFVYYI